MENKKESIVILGFGGHAKSIADSIENGGQYNIVGYTDHHDCQNQYTYLGTDDVLENLYTQGITKAVLGIGFMGNSGVRDELVKLAKSIGFEFPVIIDHSAVIAERVVLGEGTFVGKKAVINAESKIGDFCIINTAAIVEHENIIDDYSHVAVGAVLCGNVTVGHHSLIGAGTTVIQGVSVGSNCIIGAGAVVNQDLPENCTAVGVPAKVIKSISGYLDK